MFLHYEQWKRWILPTCSAPLGGGTPEKPVCPVVSFLLRTKESVHTDF